MLDCVNTEARGARCLTKDNVEFLVLTNKRKRHSLLLPIGPNLIDLVGHLDVDD
jgi:hypothetical protein